MIKSILRHLSALGLLAVVVGLQPAQAAVVNFTPGDLVVGFQRGAADSDLYLVSLGSITTFRDASGPLVNITNINTDLETAFGSGWYNLTDLYIGAFSMYSRTTANPNGDPGQTVYISRARTSVGTQSTPWSAIGTSDNNTIGAAISGVQTTFDAATAGNNANGAIMLTSASTYDNSNPPTTAALSWGIFNAAGLGTQYKFDGSTFGNFGVSLVGVSEAAIDLYRIAGESSNPGTQNGSFTGASSYISTITIDSSGNISAVPEPSTFALLGLVGVSVAGYCIRRRKS